MIIIGVSDVRKHLSSLLERVERVERGEEVLITRHGKAIARLVPATAADRADVQAVVVRMKELRMRTTLGGLSWKERRDEGRR